MHPTVLAAAHAAATAQMSASDRQGLAIGAAVLVFVFGLAMSNRKKPSTGK